MQDTSNGASFAPWGKRLCGGYQVEAAPLMKGAHAIPTSLVGVAYNGKVEASTIVQGMYLAPCAWLRPWAAKLVITARTCVRSCITRA